MRGGILVAPGGTGDGGSGAAPSTLPLTPNPDDDGTGTNNEPVPSDNAAVLSPVDEFRDRLAYREELRNEIIENRLDDRHDLDGNTLYRIKFDATVIPQHDTSGWALIKVLICGSLSDSCPSASTPPQSAAREPSPIPFAEIQESPIEARNIRDRVSMGARLSAQMSLEELTSWRGLYRDWAQNIGAVLQTNLKEFEFTAEPEDIVNFAEFELENRLYYDFPVKSEQHEEKVLDAIYLILASCRAKNDLSERLDCLLSYIKDISHT